MIQIILLNSEVKRISLHKEMIISEQINNDKINVFHFVNTEL